MSEFAGKLEEAYGVKLPKVLSEFFEKGDYGKYGKIDFVDGYSTGTYNVFFEDNDLLDWNELAVRSGVDDMRRGGELSKEKWLEKFPGIVPFAILEYPEGNAEEELPKQFLVVDVIQEGCPVLLWEYDGWRLYPIAATLADFLAGKPAQSREQFREMKKLSDFMYKEYKWIS